MKGQVASSTMGQDWFCVYADMHDSQYVNREELQSLAMSVEGRTLRVIHVISSQYIWSVKSDRTGEQMTGAVDAGYESAVLAAINALAQVAR
jgi:hypothetical protein